MAMDKQKQLVTRLFEKTSADKIEWKATAQDNSFRVSFSRTSVEIEEICLVRQRDYAVHLISEKGDVVDTFTDVDLDATESTRKNDDDSWHVFMKNLYAMARRAALGSEKVLKEILGELDDEIPF